MIRSPQIHDKILSLIRMQFIGASGDLVSVRFEEILVACTQLDLHYDGRSVGPSFRKMNEK